MRPLAALVLSTALFAAGCGDERTDEVHWADVPASPASAPASTSPGRITSTTADVDDLRLLEEAINRSQIRLGEAPALLALMNPIGGQTDIPEAARRTARLMAECRADQEILAQAAEKMAEAWPDPERAPVPILLRQTRAAAHRFREWALVELLRATDRTARDLLARGTPSTAELLLAGAALDGLRYSHEGAILLRRYLAIAPVALARAARPEEKLHDLAIVLVDTRMMALAWGPAQWSEKEGAEVRKHIEAYRARVNSLPGPCGPPIARLVTRWWDWSMEGNGYPMDAERTAATAADLRALGALLPASKPLLEAVAGQVAAGQ